MAQEDAAVIGSAGHDEAEVLVKCITSTTDVSAIIDQPYSICNSGVEVVHIATSVVGRFELIPRQRFSLKSVWQNFSRSIRYFKWRKAGFTPSPYFSTRIQRLSEQKNTFDSKLEFEIESSRCHWTKTLDSEDEHERVPNSDMFERLKEDSEWGLFFWREPYELQIGKKIAEGGQVEIFEAVGKNRRDGHKWVDVGYMCEYKNYGRRKLVAKVFKKGFFLQDLQQMWPLGVAKAALPYRYFNNLECIATNGLCWALGAQLLEDGRFAFLFERHWSDLRKLIDMKMLKSNGSPPFPLKQTFNILFNIAQGMASLHKLGLLYKDLKAANILMGNYSEYKAYIADFESSKQVMGTSFWRAPEVLLALKHHSLTPETFTQQTDVYSFAMTCYEVITGLIPFEDYWQNDYDVVLRGERPPLPKNFHQGIKNLVRKCWHEDPSQRPSFDAIVGHLCAIPSSILDKE